MANFSQDAIDNGQSQYFVPFYSTMVCDNMSLSSNNTMPWCFTQGDHHREEEILIRVLYAIVGLLFAFGMPLNITTAVLIAVKKELHSDVYVYFANSCISSVLVLCSMLSFILYLLNEENVHMSKEFHQFFFPSIDVFFYTLSSLLNDFTILAICYHELSEGHDQAHPKPVKVVVISWFLSGFMFVLSCCRMVPSSVNMYRIFVVWLTTVPNFLVGMLASLTFAITVLLRLKAVVMKIIAEWCDISSSNGQDQNMSSCDRLSLRWLLPPLAGWCFVYSVFSYEIIAKHLFLDVYLNFILMTMPWIISASLPVWFLCSSTMLRACFKAFLTNFMRTRLRKKSSKEPTLQEYNTLPSYDNGVHELSLV